MLGYVLLRNIRGIGSRISPVIETYRLMFRVGNRITKFRFLFLMQAKNSEICVCCIQVCLALSQSDPEIIV
jgi:hypothetical protein